MTEEQGEREDEALPANEDVIERAAEAADPQAEYAEPDRLGSAAREQEPPDEAGDA